MRWCMSWFISICLFVIWLMRFCVKLFMRWYGIIIWFVRIMINGFVGWIVSWVVENGLFISVWCRDSIACIESFVIAAKTVFLVAAHLCLRLMGGGLWVRKRVHNAQLKALPLTTEILCMGTIAYGPPCAVETFAQTQTWSYVKHGWFVVETAGAMFAQTFLQRLAAVTLLFCKFADIFGDA